MSLHIVQNMNNLAITIIQSNLLWENPEGNLEHFDQLLKEVPSSTDLVLLPETFNTGFPVDPLKFAETPDGPTLNWLRTKAQELHAVVCGTMLLNVDGHYHNSLVWMRPDGSYELYHKRHTFAIGGEKEPIEPGTESLIVTLNGWKIKPLVCYDIRFPIWARNQYLDGTFDYDLGIYLANFPSSRIFVWDTLLMARAIENQAYFIGVNRIGDDPEGVHYNGDSQVISPKGEVLANTEPDTEAILSYTLDYEKLQNFRSKFPVGCDWDGAVTQTSQIRLDCHVAPQSSAPRNDGRLSIFSDEYYMRQAFKEAELALEADEIPIGAVMVCSDKIIARSHNQTEMLNDVTAHAEMLAITAASNALGAKYLDECTLYVTLEPCPMCASALEHAHIGKVVYAADDPKNGYARYGNMLHPKTKLVTGVMKEECLALLTDFFKKKR